MVKFFTSMQVGLALIALIAISSIIATLDPQSTMYTSIWYRGLLLLLSINLLICTSKRLPDLFKKLRNNISENDLSKLNFTKAQKVSNPDPTYATIKDFLINHGFQVKSITNNTRTLLVGKKGKMDLLAPHLIHISILIIVIGALIGNFGTTENVKCFVGGTSHIPQTISQGLSIKLKDFQTLYDTNDAIANWQSDFTLYKDGQAITEASTKVNDPFKYEGIKFYQSAYGYTHNVSITMGKEKRPFNFPHNQFISLRKDIAIVFTEENRQIVLKEYQNKQLTNTIALNPNKEIALAGVNLTYEGLSPYSVLKVKTDPGLPVVMPGFILLSIGFMLSWLGKYQEVRIGLDHSQELVNISVITRSKSKRANLKEELNKHI